jgi:hypothetical protein
MPKSYNRVGNISKYFKMKNIIKLLIVGILFVVQNLSAQTTNYIQSTSSSAQSGLSLFHNSEIKLGNTISAIDRTRCVLKFGEANNVQIGEFEKDNRLSFKAMECGFNGDIYMAYGKNLTLSPSSAVGDNRLRFQHNGVHGYIDFKDNLNFRPDVSWVSSLTLYGDGNVGIGFGTTYVQGDYKTQGFKLAVNGGILCEEVKVITNVPDADYVFETEYSLRTIPELESYIKENKHLPNIPSADQFKSNGYKIGDMDEMLLLKIEEFSLYLIEQNKRIETLEQENKYLKEKLNR